MSRTAVIVRRSVTLVAVAAAIGAGLLVIRVAAAWTAESAPLQLTPVSVAALQGQLLDEQGRSSALVAELERLDAEAAELSAALEAAQGRITADGDHADELTADLRAAKQKLKKLERAIADARSALARQSETVTVRTVQRSEDRDDDHDDDDHDEHEEEDDD